MASCGLCRQRKAKRACPARGEAICPPCCGSRRRVEIACPEECVYLGGSHAGAWAGRETERRRDARRVVAAAQDLSEIQTQALFLALVGVVGMRAERPELGDRLLLDAVSALRKTVESRGRGLLYEHPTEDARAQAVVVALREVLEPTDEAGRPVPLPDRDQLTVLQAMEAGLAEAVREEAGPTAWLDSAGRLVAEAIPARPAPTPLIVEP